MTYQKTSGLLKVQGWFTGTKVVEDYVIFLFCPSIDFTGGPENNDKLGVGGEKSVVGNNQSELV